MAVPRNRTSNQKKNSRRAHHAKKAFSLSRCANCGTPSLSHRICASCGVYDRKQVIAEKAK